MADVMGKGSGEQFNIEVTVNVTQAKTALAGISKSLDSITKKVGTLTSKIIDLQSRITALYSQPINTQLMLNVSFVSANVDEASLDAAVQNIVSRIKARLQLAGEQNQFALPVTLTSKGGKGATSVDTIVAMTTAMQQAVTELTKNIQNTSESINKLDEGLSKVTKKATQLKRVSGGRGQGGLLDKVFLSRGVTYSTVYETIFGQLGYLVWAVRNVSLTASNIGRTIKSMVIDTVGVQQNFMLTLTAITGSLEKANELKNTIWEISRTVGVDMASLMHTAQQAAVYNIPYQRIQDMLQTIPVFAQMVGTVSGGGAAGASAITSRAIMAIGQMYAKGKVVAEERRQLANIGINIVELIAQGMGKPPAEVEDMMRKGLLTNVDEVVGMIMKELGKKTDAIVKYIGTTTTGALNIAISSLNQIWTAVAGTIAKTLMPVLLTVSSVLQRIAAQVTETGNLFLAIKNNVSSWLYNMIVTTYAWLVNIYNIIANIFKVVINILFGTSNILRPILMTLMAGTLIFWITSSILRLMKPMIGFLKTIWTMSVYIKENFKTWIGWISGAAKGLVGVITGAKSLSAVLSGIMAKATITANMLTLGIATAIFALSLYLVNVVDRTLNRKINQSLDKLEQQTKEASDTMKNAFIQPTQDTAKMKDNMSSVADSTKEIKDNLQSFDVIHAIEQQAEMVANIPEVPETIIDIEMQDYSKFLDNLVKEATNIDTSITSAVIPKLDDLSIGIGDIAYTIKNDFANILTSIRDRLFGQGATINGIYSLMKSKMFPESENKIPGEPIPPMSSGYMFAPGFAKSLANQIKEYNTIKNAIEGVYKLIPTGFNLIPGVTDWFAEKTVDFINWFGGKFLGAQPIQISIEEAIKDTPEFITREIRINGNRVKIP